MLCQECGKKKATIHLTKIINNEKTELYLCPECAQKRGEWGFGEDPISLHNFFPGFLGALESGRKTPTTSAGKETCSVCGLTYEDFKEKGQLGCKECYLTFKDQLTPLVKRIHGREEHRGKVPRRTGGLIRKRREIEELRHKMEEAVQEENFEEAARLRDKIKELENEMKG